MNLQFDYTVTRSEFNSAYQLVANRLYDPIWGLRLGPWLGAAMFLSLLVTGGCLLLAWRATSYALAGPIFGAWSAYAVGVTVFLAASALFGWALVRGAVSDDGLSCGHRTVTISESGVVVQTPKARLELQWSAIRTAYWTRTGLLLLADATCFVQVPQRVVPRAERSALDAFVQSRVRKVRRDREVRSQPAAPVPSQAIPEKTQQAPARGGVGGRLRWFGGRFLENLSSGLKLALVIVKGDRRHVHGAASQLIAVVTVLVVVTLLLDYLAVGRYGRIDPLQLGRFAILLLLVLLVGALAAGFTRDRALALKYSVLAVAAAIWVTIIPEVLVRLTGRQPDSASAWSYLLPILWWNVMAAMAFFHVARKATWRHAVATWFALAVFLSFSTLWPSGRLWIADAQQAVNAGAGELHPGREEVLFLQPELLEGKLRELSAQRPGVTDLYFVSAGLHGEQDVFMNEARDFRKRFDDEFGTAKRSVSLINNPRTARAEPLANSTSLRRTLRHIGSIMDPEEDVLFLYLTSHGDCRQGLSVVFRPFQFRSLDAVSLKQMLDEAGIKWRVIVISACQSGALVKGLEDPNTLIMTSAAAERFSRGCGQNSTYTDFGDAYFNHSLQKTRSFVEAFYLARTMVTEQERKDGVEQSDPQISRGSAIETKLAALAEEGVHPLAASHAADVTGLSPGAQRLAAGWPAEDFLRDHRRRCWRRMEPISPEALYKKDRNYFSGAAPGGREWQFIDMAFDRYAEAYCEPMSAPELRRLYAGLWSRVSSTQDLEAIAAFEATRPGQLYVQHHLDVETALRDQMEERVWERAKNSYWYYARTVDWARKEMEKRRRKDAPR